MRGNMIFILVIVSVLVGGCGGSGSYTFVDYDFSFGFLERVAVIPFENLSNEQGAGARVTRYFTSALLAAEAFDVVEPGDVALEIQKLNVARTGELPTANVVSLGQELGVQGLFLGTISESATNRSGGRTVRVVTLVVRLLETETGKTVWSTTVTRNSSSFSASVFGTGQKSMSEVTRDCVDDCLDTLFD